MSQGVLPFQYEEEKKSFGQTGLAGFPVYLDLIHRMNLGAVINRHLGVRSGSQGWTDSEMVLGLVFLNLAGGDCVEDLRILQSDEGFCQVLDRTRLHGLPRCHGKARAIRRGRPFARLRRSCLDESAVQRTA